MSEPLLSEARIEELAAEARRWSVCAGEPHYVNDAIRQAVKEAGEAAAKVSEAAGQRPATDPFCCTPLSAEIAAEIRKRLPDAPSSAPAACVVIVDGHRLEPGETIADEIRKQLP